WLSTNEPPVTVAVTMSGPPPRLAPPAPRLPLAWLPIKVLLVSVAVRTTPSPPALSPAVLFRNSVPETVSVPDTDSPPPTPLTELVAWLLSNQSSLTVAEPLTYAPPPEKVAALPKK